MGMCTNYLSHILMLKVPVLMGPGSGMALRRAFSDGDWRYKCCEKEGKMTENGKDDENGCTQMCDFCNQSWGSGKPCVMITHPDRGLQESLKDYKVVIKDHELQDI